jgi:hypothetical protein
MRRQAIGVANICRSRYHATVSKRRTSFFLDPALGDGLKALKARDGVGEGEAIRRAIAEYLEKRGISNGQKAERQRAATRRRS